MTITHEINAEERHMDSHSHDLHTTHRNTQESPLMFNGIPISDAVINQLKMNSSVPISRLTRAEIEDAVIGFEGDAQIVEDENAHSLTDKMHKTWDEELPDIQSINFVVTEAGYWVNSIHAYTAGVSIHHEMLDDEHMNKNTDETPSFVDRYLASKHSNKHFTPTFSF